MISQKYRTVSRFAVYLLACAMTLTLLVPFCASEAAPPEVLTYGIVSSAAYLRTGPTTSEPSIMQIDGKNPLIVYKGTVLIIEDTVSSTDSKTGYQNPWYKVKYTYMATGKELECYVYSDNVIARTGVVYAASSDATFEASLEQFPAAYRPYLRAIHATYPNWTFEAYDTGLDFNEYVELQSKVTKNEGSSESVSFSELSTTRTNPKWRASNEIVDGNSFYHASKDVVAYYLDTRNFLNEVDILQFETLAYDPTKQNIEGVKSILAGSFWDNREITDTKGNKVLVAQAYMDAAETSGVNPYSLAISTILENGTSGTALTKGTNGYYNYYGIGSTPGGSPQANGLAFAKNGGSSWNAEKKAKYMIPWDTTYKAIVGGALFMGTNYISIGQNTAFYKKFDVFSAKKGEPIHQYMQGIEYPVSEAFQAYKNYQKLGLLNSPKHFIIPYFQNMPEEQLALPDTSPIVLEVPAEPIKPVISECQYTISDTIISKVDPETTTENFCVSMCLPEGTEITLGGDVIGTGTKVTIQQEDQSSEYTIVIRGDINGDGKISTVDLLYLRNHILGTAQLTKAQELAADIDGTDGIKMVDLLKLRNHILQLYTISQEGIIG